MLHSCKFCDFNVIEDCIVNIKNNAIILLKSVATILYIALTKTKRNDHCVELVVTLIFS